MIFSLFLVYAQIKTRTARKKAEREALLASEEASLPSKAKSAPKAGAAKKKPVDKLVATGTGVAGFSVNDPLNLRKTKGPDGEPEEVKELSAKGIDEMLEALELVNQKTDKATVGSKVKSFLWVYLKARWKLIEELGGDHG